MKKLSFEIIAMNYTSFLEIFPTHLIKGWSDMEVNSNLTIHKSVNPSLFYGEMRLRYCSNSEAAVQLVVNVVWMVLNMYRIRRAITPLECVNVMYFLWPFYAARILSQGV